MDWDGDEAVIGDCNVWVRPVAKRCRITRAVELVWRAHVVGAGWRCTSDHATAAEARAACEALARKLGSG